jgi:DNA polymerase III alpha subunit
VLRRAMSGKYRSKAEFKRIVEKFFDNCKKLGYPDEITREVWRQIESFAGYSFSKAHSASYAVESFQSLFLKTYYPLEFMVAVINNFGGYYRSWVYVNEARRWGAAIVMPCVNEGQYHTSIKGTTVWIGFVHISNLEANFAEAIIRERESRGLFTGLPDFLERVPAGLEQVILLIRCNAFRFTGRSKKELLWEAHMLLGAATKRDVANSLFGIPVQEFSLPPLVQEHAEDAFDEMELLGFPVSLSHFDLLQTSFRGEIMASGMTAQLGKRVRMLGNLVTIKNVRTVKKEWMHFGCFLDVQGEFFDTVHFPDSLTRYPFRGQGVYLLLGRVVEEFGFPSLEVEKMAKMPFVKDPRYI